MTSDQRLTLILAGMSLLFTMMCVLIAVIYNAGKQIGKTQTEMMTIAEDVKEVAQETKSIAQSLNRHIDWHLERNRR